eukprot:81459_1
MTAAIYLNDVAVTPLDATVVLPGESALSDHRFEFGEEITLSPSTTYSLVFSADIPAECGHTDLLLSSSSSTTDRRLLAETTTLCLSEFTANPDSCELGKKLAKSEDMIAGVAQMCDDADTTERTEIESGLFRQHISQSAIKEHLISTGSLDIYDVNGVKTTFTDFPKDEDGNNIFNPCIAVDEANLRIYSIGGKDASDNAVNTITVWQFDDDTLTSGQVVVAPGKWRLDKKRYGAMCMYYKRNDVEWLIVINGMKYPSDELLRKDRFFNDVRLFYIPPDPNTYFLTNFPSTLSVSYPDGNTVPYQWKDATKISLAVNVIDAKPMFLSNTSNNLYLFGGE